jgi:hypothetical protein
VPIYKEAIERILKNYPHIVHNLPQKRFDSEQMVFEAGQLAKEMFFIVKGDVDLLDGDAEAEVLVSFEQHEVIGELALFQEGAHRQCSARACGPVLTRVCSKTKWRDLIKTEEFLGAEVRQVQMRALFAPAFEDDPYADKVPIVDALFRAIDTDGNGSLSAEEFVAFAMTRGILRSEAELMFSSFDTDGSGDLDAEEFFETIKSFTEVCALEDAADTAAMDQLKGLSPAKKKKWERRFKRQLQDVRKTMLGKKAVRVGRSNSTQMEARRQGDTEAIAPSSLMARGDIQKAPELRAAVRRFWTILRLDGSFADGPRLPRDVFVGLMYVLVFIGLMYGLVPLLSPSCTYYCTVIAQTLIVAQTPACLPSCPPPPLSSCAGVSRTSSSWTSQRRRSRRRWRRRQRRRASCERRRRRWTANRRRRRRSSWGGRRSKTPRRRRRRTRRRRRPTCRWRCGVGWPCKRRRTAPPPRQAWPRAGAVT